MLVVVSPLLGALPGPGGVIVFGLGLAMMLKTSMWAKRHYVRFKRWQPKVARWTDWGLMRKSARRRAERRKQQRAARQMTEKPRPRMCRRWSSRSRRQLTLTGPCPIGAPNNGRLPAALFLSEFEA